jgi:hypothetical protein
MIESDCFSRSQNIALMKHCLEHAKALESQVITRLACSIAEGCTVKSAPGGPLKSIPVEVDVSTERRHIVS